MLDKKNADKIWLHMLKTEHCQLYILQTDSQRILCFVLTPQQAEFILANIANTIQNRKYANNS